MNCTYLFLYLGGWVEMKNEAMLDNDITDYWKIFYFQRPPVIYTSNMWAPIYNNIKIIDSSKGWWSETASMKLCSLPFNTPEIEDKTNNFLFFVSRQKIPPHYLSQFEKKAMFLDAKPTYSGKTSWAVRSQCAKPSVYLPIVCTFAKTLRMLLLHKDKATPYNHHFIMLNNSTSWSWVQFLT